MVVLADEHVDPEIIRFLHDRGHDARSVRRTPLRGQPDEALAEAADQLGGIVLTWNHRDFSQLISRRPPLNYDPYPNAGRLSFVCPEPMGPRRLCELIEDIEHEYRVVLARRERRLIMVIGDTWFRIDR